MKLMFNFLSNFVDFIVHCLNCCLLFCENDVVLAYNFKLAFNSFDKVLYNLYLVFTGLFQAMNV
jgi:hypothetical protein